MKVTLLSHSLSDNCFGRVHLLSEIIKRFAEVEIIGLNYKNSGLWYPLRNNSHNIISLNYNRKAQFLKLIPIMSACVTGDLVISSKPLLHSFGTGLFTKFTKNIPLILDIDDWEWGFARQQSANHNIYGTSKIIEYSKNFIDRGLFDKLSCFADAIMVSNEFLQNKYSGSIIPHYRDTCKLNPSIDGSFLKKKWEIPLNKKIIMFLGTPRKHKGIEDLVDAYNLINCKKTILLIIGCNNADTDFINMCKSEKFRKKGIYYLPQQPFEHTPYILSIADIIVIPQKKTDGSIGQIPAKLFDAMAMGKPIISTRVSDIPKILSNDCGIVVNPGCPDDIAVSIDRLLLDTDLRLNIGANARKKAVKHYSYEKGETDLKRVLNSTITKRQHKKMY